MPGVIVDGMDVVAVHEATAEAVARARRGDGPSLIEAKTYRFYNHHGVQNLGLKYRPDDEVAAWKQRDPIFTFEERLIELGTATGGEIEEVWAELRDDIATAISFAEESPSPEPDQLLVDVYTRMPRTTRRIRSPVMSERKLSYAMAFNEAVRQAMDADPNVFCAGEDIGAFGGVFGTFGGLQAKFGERAGGRHADQRAGDHRPRHRRRGHRSAADRRPDVHGLHLRRRWTRSSTRRRS